MVSLYKEGVCKLITHKKITLLLALAITIMAHSYIGNAQTTTATDIQLLINGKNITHLSTPVVVNDRILVPLKVVSEELGATVTWDADYRTVSVVKGNKNIFLWIGSRLVKYDNGQAYILSDVAPVIINSKTYVPLKLISNGLRIGITWDEATRSVMIDSTKTSALESIYDVKITSHENGALIDGKTDITFDILGSYKDKVAETRLVILDPKTAKGHIVANTKNFEDTLTYLPKVEDKGQKILVLALYDENRQFIGGDAIGIQIAVVPKVDIIGLSSLPYKDEITLQQDMNFLAHYIQYEIKNVKTGQTEIITERDPDGTFTWVPSFEKNGDYEIKVTAYDGNDIGYSSDISTVTFDVDRYLYMGGVSSKRTLNGAVDLTASRNFDVTSTAYWIRDVQTGASDLIAQVPYGAYTWTPEPNYMGEKEFYVKVTDVRGTVHTSAPVRVTIDNRPYLSLVGVGPHQVLTDTAELSVKSNVHLDDVRYILKNETTGHTRILSEGLSSDASYTFTPLASDGEAVTLYAEGHYNGQKLTSEAISFKIYLGNLYTAKPIIERDQYLNFASQLAVDSYHKTGMSAALQTAQAILETGWGQSIPVDKYTGQFSYNLFGIKGTGTNGSVISNTWEVYNGVKFRVDANFRAYNNVGESWDDHKKILLDLSRYEPYRAVMYDSTLGAWAIRRAGYATDPQYPIKLMNIIKQYHLETLDEIGIE